MSEKLFESPECPRVHLEFGAAKRAYWILMALGAAPIMFGMSPALAGHHEATIGLSCLLVGYVAAVAIWLKAYKIRIRGGYLEYKSLFGKKRILISEIKSANVRIGYETWLDRFKPYCRLEVAPSPCSPRSPININVRVFSSSDVADLIQLLKRCIADPTWVPSVQ